MVRSRGAAAFYMAPRDSGWHADLCSQSPTLRLGVAGRHPGLRLRCGCGALQFPKLQCRSARQRARVCPPGPPSILRVDLPEGAHLQLFSLRLLHVARTHRLPDTNAAGCGLGCHYTKTKYPDGLAPSSSLHAGLTYVTYVCDVCDVCTRM